MSDGLTLIRGLRGRSDRGFRLRACAVEATRRMVGFARRGSRLEHTRATAWAQRVDVWNADPHASGSGVGSARLFLQASAFLHVDAPLPGGVRAAPLQVRDRVSKLLPALRTTARVATIGAVTSRVGQYLRRAANP